MPTTTTTPALRHHGGARAIGRRVVAVALVVALAMTAIACGDSDHQVSGWVREPLPAVDTVALPDVANGDAPFAFRAPPGEVLLVYFGYTFCPDVCPTTLSDLQAALAQLGEDAQRVEVAFVTVDPGRDVGDKLAGYIGFFTDGRGHALRTDDPELLATAAAPFGVEYDVTTNAEGEIEVGHTASLFAVDDRGQLLLTWPFGIPAEVLAGDLTWLLGASDGAGMQERVAT